MSVSALAPLTGSAFDSFDHQLGKSGSLIRCQTLESGASMTALSDTDVEVGMRLLFDMSDILPGAVGGNDSVNGVSAFVASVLLFDRVCGKVGVFCALCLRPLVFIDCPAMMSNPRALVCKKPRCEDTGKISVGHQSEWFIELIDSCLVIFEYGPSTSMNVCDPGHLLDVDLPDLYVILVQLRDLHP